MMFLYFFLKKHLPKFGLTTAVFLIFCGCGSLEPDSIKPITITIQSQSVIVDSDGNKTTFRIGEDKSELLNVKDPSKSIRSDWSEFFDSRIYCWQRNNGLYGYGLTIDNIRVYQDNTDGQYHLTDIVTDKGAHIGDDSAKVHTLHGKPTAIYKNYETYSGIRFYYDSSWKLEHIAIFDKNLPVKID